MPRFITLFLLFLPTAVLADSIIQTPAEANALLNRPEIVVLDTRPYEAYLVGHLPGAFQLDTKSLYRDSADYELHFPEFPVLATALGKAGIKRTDSVLVYGDNLLVTREAGMMALFLLLAGQQQVYFLDGGLQAWKKVGLPVVKDFPSRLPQTYDLQIRTDWLADQALVLDYQTKGTGVLVDTRSPEEFSGTLPGNHIPRPGHIPQAVSLDFRLALDSNGQFRPRSELEQVYSSTNEKPVILYCRTGPRTAVAGLALLDRLGRKNLKFYLGSFMEWSHDPKMVVVKGN